MANVQMLFPNCYALQFQVEAGWHLKKSGIERVPRYRHPQSTRAGMTWKDMKGFPPTCPRREKLLLEIVFERFGPKSFGFWAGHYA